jgi:hypothetical protein
MTGGNDRCDAVAVLYALNKMLKTGLISSSSYANVTNSDAPMQMYSPGNCNDVAGSLRFNLEEQQLILQIENPPGKSIIFRYLSQC